MTQTVNISCPEGIQRLIDMGRAVAHAQSWTKHPHAREAFVGLWLDAVLTRADMRNRAEIVGTRVQATVTGEPLSGDAALIDRAAKDWIDYCAALARSVGESPANTTNVEIRLPRETGAWPLAVLCVVVGTGILAGGWIGGKVVDWWISKGERGTVEDMVADGAAQTLELGQKAREENRSLTEAEKLAIENRHAQTQAAIANLTAKEDSSFFGDISPQTLIGAGLVLGLIYALTRSPK
jgi:hypothetical protein